ncbi:MAG: gamma-glutamyltransferase family protein, partial [Pseudomonadota bacterium]
MRARPFAWRALLALPVRGASALVNHLATGLCSHFPALWMRARACDAVVLASIFLFALTAFHAPVVAQDARAAGQSGPSRANPEAGAGGTRGERGAEQGQAAKQPGGAVTSHASLVVTANDHATRAAEQILNAGGSAVDAAIAAQLVLSMVEPQSSGLGGGGFALVHTPAASTGERRLTAYDGRETAPLGAKPTRFLGRDGTPFGFIAAAKSWRSIGTPGLPYMLTEMHADHGTLSWQELFVPALEIAREGFAVSPRLHGLLTWMGAKRFAPEARAQYFTADGAPVPIGTVLRSPAFGRTLQRFAETGEMAFRSGPIVEAILARAQPGDGGEGRRPRGGNVGEANKGASASPDDADQGVAGRLRQEDFARYQVKRRAAVCAHVSREYEVCGMPPPSSGGSTVLQALLLGRAAIARGQQADGAATGAVVVSTHRRLEAANLAFADRNHFIGDPDFVAVPLPGLLAPAYVTRRAGLIRPQRAGAPFAHGKPPGWDTPRGSDGDGDGPGTTHLSIVDRTGQAVAMTTSIETAFGSGITAAGMLLNNQLTDFAFVPVDAAGGPRANRLQAGKRPRSSMAPTLVYKNGALFAVLGSPGGSRIIGYVARAIEGLLFDGLDPQAAAQRPHVLSRNGPAELEKTAALDGLAEGLRARGHEVRRAEMTSGLHIIA